MLNSIRCADRSELFPFKPVSHHDPFLEETQLFQKGDYVMTPLRQRMTEDMRLAGYSARTQEAYVGAVRQMFNHFQCTPAQLTEEQLREYFLYLTHKRRVSRSTATIAICGVKFFFERTLKRDWTALELIRPRPEKKLPAVLSREEVRRILEHVHTAAAVSSNRLLDGRSRATRERHPLRCSQKPGFLPGVRGGWIRWSLLNNCRGESTQPLAVARKEN
jgi:hypothetical protein